jgi:predicted enzyme related to lactoylglutathione lyase
MNKHRFVWHDLNTKDLAASQRFYGESFGWSFGKSDNGPYVHISAGSEMIGGMRQMDANEPQPTSWLGYIGVDDVAAAVTTITSSGGKVFMPTMQMPNVGTFAVTADPSGAAFAPWKSARAGEDVEKTGPAALYTFIWDELVTTNPEAVSKFYASVFGWTPRSMDMGGGMTYTLFDRPGVKNFKGDQQSAGGMMKAPEGVPYSFWLPYVHVDNTDARSERATKLGAKVMVAPTDIPNVGRFACWMDPQGASIAVLQPQM